MLNLKKAKKKNKGGQLILSVVLGVYGLACLLPMLLILIVSFSSEVSVQKNGFSFFPSELSLNAYSYVLAFVDQLIQSYMITIFETVVGTTLSLFVTSMFAYVLSRKEFYLNRILSLYLLITMLFSGGLLSSYLVNSNIWGMRNNLLVLILPSAVTSINCIIMRTFIKTNLPDSLVESARIDGASEFLLFFRIVIPIMKPAIAAIGFMIAIGHWNEWQTAYLYIDNPKYATLQLMLIRIEKNLEFLQERISSLSIEELEMLRNAPTETARMAILLCTIGPIMFAYPFFQKYFIKGITMGAVKG